jgi:glycine/D-amino acid oxidase-like deaminating enzyme
MKSGTESLWLTAAATPPFDPLYGENDAEVVVIGAGITGLTAAVLLAERGRKVVILEAGRVGRGETGHTTAHLTEAVDARYHFLTRSYDAEVAQLVAEGSRSAIEQIERFTRELSIDCDFRRVPAYLYTESRNKVAELKNEAASAAKAGLSARWVEDVPLPFESRGGVRYDNQAQFHPARYVAGLLEHLVSKGVRIYEASPVTAIETG